jgi:GT2 family glycosyltransferase
VARGEHLVLLNDDVVFLNQRKNDWLNALLKPFCDPTVGVAGPLTQRSITGHRFVVFFLAVLSRRCYETMGPLDEVFGEGAGEDTAYCIEAERRGFRVAQVPEENPSLPSQGGLAFGPFPVYHAGEATLKKLLNWNDIVKRNGMLLLERYGNRGTEEVRP